MRLPLVLAAFVVGIGGTGHAAPFAPIPVRAATSHVALYAYAVDQGGLATPLGACEDIAANDRASCRKLEAAIADARRTLVYADLRKAGRRAPRRLRPASSRRRRPTRKRSARTRPTGSPPMPRPPSAPRRTLF